MSYAPIKSDSSISARKTKPDTNHRTRTESTTRTQTSGTARPSGGKRAHQGGIEHDQKYPIIVHSHLCWDWVWQRPQQFISRLSQRHSILFIETVAPDPELASPLAKFRTLPELPNITILRLQFPEWQWPDGAKVDAERLRIVKEFVTQGPLASKFANPVQWFYDPMAVTAFAGEMNERLIVYDCMDELSKFRGAPPAILEREAELLSRAAVVFTGGRKMYESKSRHNDNCHFYGCGVDIEHFGKARLEETATPADVANLPRPIFGYFGVVDERMDYELVARLADANKDGSVVIIGPATKVDPTSLPQKPNLHWLGQRGYAELPAYCKAFDVCLMPFALNESTEYINPTKALEYMATAKPIVSTPVADVVTNFGAVVQIAKTPEEFIEQSLRAAEQPDRDAIARGLDMVLANSWESIVNKLENHVEDALLRTSAKA